MKCPRCGLLNPDTAQRCDCGFDFDRGTVEKPYYIQKLPKSIKVYLILVIVGYVLGFLFSVSLGDLIYMIEALLWAIIFYALYFLFVKKKKNWARILLIIITFPIGLILFISPEVKLYMLQPHE